MNNEVAQGFLSKLGPLKFIKPPRLNNYGSLVLHCIFSDTWFKENIIRFNDAMDQVGAFHVHDVKVSENDIKLRTMIWIGLKFLTEENQATLIEVLNKSSKPERPRKEIEEQLQRAQLHISSLEKEIETIKEENTALKCLPEAEYYLEAKKYYESLQK